MPARKLFITVLWVQGAYTLLTALWALIDIKSFMQVTGPKTDIWLVKTVAVLLLAIGVCFIANALVKTNPIPVILLAMITAAGLAFIEFYYTAIDTIKWVYALDGVLEVLFLLVWTILLLKYKKQQFLSGQ